MIDKSYKNLNNSDAPNWGVSDAPNWGVSGDLNLGVTDDPNWNALSDRKLSELIGAFVKHHRLEQDKTQDELAKAAGISRSTLSLLERGEAVTLATLLQVLRMLDKLNVLKVFSVQQPMSPLVLAKIEKNRRQRVSGKKDRPRPEPSW